MVDLTAILSALAFLALTALFAWWLNRQTVEEPVVYESHVHAEPLWDWEVRCPDWRPSSIITPAEWDAMCWRLRKGSGVA